MKQLPQNPEISVPSTDILLNSHRFQHEAMASIFEIIIIYEDTKYARQAAHAAFDELDRIELQLSRFIENSDISQINNLDAGQPLLIGLDAFECLRLSKHISEETNGAFDVTIGRLFSCWLSKDRTLLSPSKEELDFACEHTGSNLIILNELEHTAELSASPVHVDLGGIGKGFAVDRMADILRQWSIDAALIHGGCSTVFAIGAPGAKKGWPVTISNPKDRKQTLAYLDLCDQALSGSGLQKGRHIIDPRTQQPIEVRLAAWSSAPDAATADALSTAFMVMDTKEIQQYCLKYPDTMAMVVLQEKSCEQKEKILQFGPWKIDKTHS